MATCRSCKRSPRATAARRSACRDSYRAACGLAFAAWPELFGASTRALSRKRHQGEVRTMVSQSRFRFGLIAALFLGGCAKVPPPVTEVEGVVLLNDQPLPQAQIEFVPDLKDFGAELNSTAVTDEKGRFTLT